MGKATIHTKKCQDSEISKRREENEEIKLQLLLGFIFKITEYIISTLMLCLQCANSVQSMNKTKGSCSPEAQIPVSCKQTINN